MAGDIPTSGTTSERHGDLPPPARREGGIVGAGVAVGRVALLPARVVLRLVPVGRHARALAGEVRGAATRATTSAVEDVLAGPEAQHVIDRALAGPLPESVAHSIVERNVAERMARAATEGRDGTWPADDLDRLLASPEFERALDSALEQVLSSPALRKALTHQTTTFAGEIAASVRRRAAVADAAVERPARRAVRRRPRVQVAGFARPGGFVTRGVALTVDAVAVVVLYAAAVTVARAIGAVIGGLHVDWVRNTLAGGGVIVLSTAYFAGCWSIAAQTPGMRLMRVRVLGRRGRPPGLVRSLVRFAGLAVSIALLGLGFLPALVDNRRRGLPDFLARTTVVHDLEPAEPEPAALPVTT